jgi:benzoyl-CoA-dihydrodiol lyase
VIRTEGDADRVLAYEEAMTGGKDWLTNEIRHYYKRTLKRLDVTSRSLVALIEPGSCFAGPLLETALACDRQYMLEGAEIVVTDANFGAFPMGNGWTRLASRFHGEDDGLRDVRGRRLGFEEAEDLGLVTLGLDDIDWEEEVRIALEERASLSPDALTGMEANHRFAGPETLESKIFGRLSAWQNWIFTRPGASGPDGALSKYGTGQRATFDRKRV